MECPVFRGYVAWYSRNGEPLDNYPLNSEPYIRKWLLERLPFELTVNHNVGDLRDIGNSIEGKWSAYTSSYAQRHYFFESETDAMAFKLRWF